MYDYLVVGSGLYGAVCAHEARACGKSCLLLTNVQILGVISIQNK